MASRSRGEAPRPFGPLIPIDVCVALALGLQEAIVVQQLRFLIRLVDADPRHKFDGKTWIWNTYEQWAEDQIPFLSERTIRRTLRGLEDKGIVLSRQLHSYNRTKWYSLDESALAKYVASSEAAQRFLQRRESDATLRYSGRIEASNLTTSSRPATHVNTDTMAASIHKETETSTDITASNMGGAHRVYVTAEGGR